MVNWKKMLDRHLDLDLSLRVFDVDGRGDARMRSYFAGTSCSYTACDIADGENVDIILSDEHHWAKQLGLQVADVVIARNVLEHVRWPWAWLEAADAVLRRDGLFFASVPEHWKPHREPVDCWRFMQDGLQALADWVGWEVLEMETKRVRRGRDWRVTYCVMKKIRISS